MKIRADFVTNSSSSSYVDIYIENYELQKLLNKYSVSLENMNQYSEADACAYDEQLNVPTSLEDILDYVVSISRNSTFQRAVEAQRQSIMEDFLFVKWNEGFSYTDGELNGRDVHMTASSKWGIIQEQSALQPDQFDGDIDDCWGKTETRIVARPSTVYNPFRGNRPEDYRAEKDLSEYEQLLLDHIDDAPVDIRNKAIALCGFGCDYSVYDYVATDEQFEDMESPFGDRPCLKLDGNMSEEEMVRTWLDIFQCRTEDVWMEAVSSDTDYLVVCLEQLLFDEFSIEDALDTIQSAIDQGIRIISDYQLWNAIFIDGANVLDEYEKKQKEK